MTMVYPDDPQFQDFDSMDRTSTHGSHEQLQFQDNAQTDKQTSRRTRHYLPPRTVTLSLTFLIIGVVLIVVVVGIISGVVGGLIVHAMKKTDTGSAGDRSTNQQQQSQQNFTYTKCMPQNSSCDVPLPEPVVPSSVVYTRWGRTVCPGNATFVYKGYAAGSHYSQTGGMSTTICLPDDPQWGNYQEGARSSYVYAAEYEGADRLTTVFGDDVHQHDAPCCVCEATGRSTLLMIPARTSCYGDWFLEYTGYLMTSANAHTKSDVKCVDSDPEVVLGGAASNNGLLFYLVEANGKLPDPPYIKGRELACSVCTK